MRYYIRRYSDWIPSTGTGRNRRYSREAVDVLRFVADLHREGATGDMVEAGLKGRFPLNIEPQQQPLATQQQTATTAAEVQAIFSEVLGEIIQAHTASLVEEVSALRRQVEELTRRLEQQQPTATDEAQALQTEVKELRRALLDQIQRPAPASQPRPWWKFWGGDE